MARVRSACHGPEHQATPSHPPLRSVKRRAHFLLGPRCSSPALSSRQTPSRRIYQCVAAPSAAERSLEDRPFGGLSLRASPLGLPARHGARPPSPIVVPSPAQGAAFFREPRRRAPGKLPHSLSSAASVRRVPGQRAFAYLPRRNPARPSQLAAEDLPNSISSGHLSPPRTGCSQRRRLRVRARRYSGARARCLVLLRGMCGR